MVIQSKVVLLFTLIVPVLAVLIKPICLNPYKTNILELEYFINQINRFKLNACDLFLIGDTRNIVF